MSIPPNTDQTGVSVTLFSMASSVTPAFAAKSTSAASKLPVNGQQDRKMRDQTEDDNHCPDSNEVALLGMR